MKNKIGVNNQVYSKWTIKGFDTEQYAHEFLKLGLTPEKTIEIVRSSPDGQVFYVKTDCHRFALRKQELMALLVDNKE